MNSFLNTLDTKKIKLFEMGIGTVNPKVDSNMCYYNSIGYKPGASHRAWKEYFDHPETLI